MDFAQKELSEFMGGVISSVANNATSNVANNVASSMASAEKLQAFKASLRSMLENANKDSSEEFQKNLIAQFLRKSFGYDCNVRGKADLAIYDEGKAKVLFEVKSTQNKAEFVKSLSSLRDLPKASCGNLKHCHTEPLQTGEVSQKNNASRDISLRSSRNSAQYDNFSLDSKAFYESILYFLREVKQNKNNNLKHIILCTAKEFYVIKAKDYHALFVANANKQVQKAIDTAYNNCDLKSGNDTSTARFYTEIESIVRDMDNTLDFVYVNVSTLLSDEVEGDLGESKNFSANASNELAQKRERERENSAGVQIAS